MYSFLVEGFDVGTKNLTRSYVGFCKDNKTEINWGQWSTSWLCTWQSPLIVPGLVSINLIDLRISFDLLIKPTKFLKMVSRSFS